MNLRKALHLITFGLTVCLSATAQEEGGRQPTLPPNPLPYDLLLIHGHVLDSKNHMDADGDVGIKDGKIAAVAAHLDPKDALKTVGVKGFYVTPGLIDIHVHVYAGTGEKNSYAGDLSLYPDGFTLRNGITTVVDAGSSGWRSFDDFNDKIIKRSRTRVLAELNIVGAGMRGGKYEQNLEDMDGKLTGDKAKQFPGVVVGIKSAHFNGPEWKPYDQAVIAGNIANIPVMIDYGARRSERPLLDLVSTHLRPGDIYTHCFSGLRGEQNPQTGGPSEALLVMKRRGIYCDIGHGGGSFAWTVAGPIMKSGYLPDSISTDIHVGSMNNGMKDLLNVADKLMLLGESVPQVIQQMTSNPAHEIRQEQYGNLSIGAIADVAVFSVETGRYGFVDMYNTKRFGTKKLVCELTVKDGKVVYDLNGISADMWDATKHSGDERQARRWTTFNERPYSTSGQRFPASTPVAAPNTPAKPNTVDQASPKK
ncbi:MAG: amidohydrolase/deacetylase family metallohydrolase [Janthinobacterium lividum]